VRCVGSNHSGPRGCAHPLLLAAGIQWGARAGAKGPGALHGWQLVAPVQASSRKAPAVGVGLGRRGRGMALQKGGPRRGQTPREGPLRRFCQSPSHVRQHGRARSDRRSGDQGDQGVSWNWAWMTALPAEGGSRHLLDGQLVLYCLVAHTVRESALSSRGTSVNTGGLARSRCYATAAAVLASSRRVGQDLHARCTERTGAEAAPCVAVLSSCKVGSIERNADPTPTAPSPSANLQPKGRGEGEVSLPGREGFLRQETAPQSPLSRPRLPHQGPRLPPLLRPRHCPRLHSTPEHGARRSPSGLSPGY